MKLNLTGNIEELRLGIIELEAQLSFTWDEDGLLVQVEQGEGDLEVNYENGEGRIKCAQPIHFYRALGLLLEHIHRNPSETLHLHETPYFDFNGPMLDMSRNAVLKLDTVKQIIRYMAAMGLNGLMLYTEDTYEVESRPYFGYMRGRYTQAELKALDDYAALFGIEIVPCIQTLAHLAQALKWSYANEIKDQEDILLIGEEKTYAFIEDMIAAASAPFRSKRIHIGMDEAFAVGLGRYLAIHGYRDRFEMMQEHMNRVLEITKRYGLQPMIWSDMIFHFLSNDKNGFHYPLDVDFAPEKLEELPSEMQYVYWCYGTREQEKYERIMKKHKELGSTPIFAGGIHCWGSLSPNYGKTWMTSHPALKACKAQGVRDVIATAWGDNGQETNHLVILPGLQLFAEYGYGDAVDDTTLARRFKACTKLDLFEDIVALKYMDETPGVEEGNHWMANPSKYLLYQDVLQGLMDKHVEGTPEEELPAHYRTLEQRWRSCKEKTEGAFHALFAFYEQLSRVLVHKGMLGLDIKRAYADRHAAALRELAEHRLPVVHAEVNELRRMHRRLWMETNKAQGWEVLDIRYGGIMARLSTASDRLLDLVEGRVDQLDELEEERLMFDPNLPEGEGPLTINMSSYQRIVTASALV
ncbi:beta-N-acetylhexosaminidase [Paenibacillus sp. 1001270B_150601_E10]|uniref:beta-N-acetylhexosaminidase n=1 Tax=Paenibacillus sp. 1001270B_150601_E10 TaxID=2787079 RepID=UPI00189C99F1|nr:beta-N-acetylhexosaminidase [Paenibacillus sp. 1001270B_150601_E10]